MMVVHGKVRRRGDYLPLSERRYPKSPQSVLISELADT